MDDELEWVGDDDELGSPGWSARFHARQAEKAGWSARFPDPWKAGFVPGDYCRYYPGAKLSSRSGQIYYRLREVCREMLKECHAAPWPEDAIPGRNYYADNGHYFYIGVVDSYNGSPGVYGLITDDPTRFGAKENRPLNIESMYKKLTGGTKVLPLNSQTAKPEKETMTTKTMTRIDRVAALVNHKTTTCAVVIGGHHGANTLTYRVTLPMAEEIRKELDREGYDGSGVKVFVTSKEGHLRPARVQELHEIDNPKIDPDSDLTYQFVFSLRQPADLLEALDLDKKLAESLAERQRNNMRKSVLAEYGVDNATQLLGHGSEEK